MTEELKACPFCGCLAWMHTSPREVDGAAGHRIECEGRCHAMTCWWHTKAEAITAWNTRAALAPGDASAEGLSRKASDFDRDKLGQIVRYAWVHWASLQPNPKPNWLEPYEALAEPDKEADRMIGEAVASWVLEGFVAPGGNTNRIADGYATAPNPAEGAVREKVVLSTDPSMLECRMMAAQIASCTCKTKTPELFFHSEDCRFRVLGDALAEIDRLTRAAALPPPVQHALDGDVESMDLGRAIRIAEQGFNDWATKDHNAKWFRKIDGTPIPNDLPVCIAIAFHDALSRLSACNPDPASSGSGGEKQHEHKASVGSDGRPLIEERFSNRGHPRREQQHADNLSYLLKRNGSKIVNELGNPITTAAWVYYGPIAELDEGEDDGRRVVIAMQRDAGMFDGAHFTNEVTLEEAREIYAWLGSIILALTPPNPGPGVEEYIEALRPLGKPCHDCAVKTGFYSEISQELAKETPAVQSAYSAGWFCHNHPNRACRGNLDYLASYRPYPLSSAPGDTVQHEQKGSQPSRGDR